MSSDDNASDPIARTLALEPLILEYADQAERERSLPAPVAKAMAKAGLYRIAAPESFQGEACDPATQIKTIEAISKADGATGWNLMIGIESFGLISVNFPYGQTLFADPVAILSSSTAAVGQAEAVEGGYRVSGDWQFVSGCHNCDFFGGLVAPCKNGEPLGQAPRFAVVLREEIEIVDTWHVAGLRGSGSHDVRVRDIFVPEERAVSFLGEAATNADSPLARIPNGARLAYNKVGVGLGIARAAIDDFVDLATGKIPRFSSAALRERPFTQRALGQAEARLRGARAFVLEMAEELWAGALQGERPSDRQRALLQIACSDAATASAEAVDLVAEAAGTSPNWLDSPLERRVRDVRVIRQHVTVGPHHIDDAGRVLLGLPPEHLMLQMGR